MASTNRITMHSSTNTPKDTEFYIKVNCTIEKYPPEGWDEKKVTFKTDLPWVTIVFPDGSPFNQSCYTIKMGIEKSLKVKKKASNGNNGSGRYSYCLLDGDGVCKKCNEQVTPPQMVIRG